MKYLSIDLETTGINPEEDQILEFAAIYDDLKNPTFNIETAHTFHVYLNRERIQGNIFAILMNTHTFKSISEYQKNKNKEMLVSEDTLVSRFHDWAFTLFRQNKINTAGKNFGSFDLQFIKKLKMSNCLNFRHRSLDIGSLYFDPKIDDVIPDLQTCLSRAGINEVVNHCALDDAYQVIKLIRHHYGLEY